MGVEATNPFGRCLECGRRRHGGVGGAGPVPESGRSERHHARQQRLRGWPRLGPGDEAGLASGDAIAATLSEASMHS